MPPKESAAHPIDEDDDDDDVPLGGLKKVIAAEKIIEMRRQEEEALAAEPSLGVNEEWCIVRVRFWGKILYQMLVLKKYPDLQYDSLVQNCPLFCPIA